jgi:glutaredoxin
MSKFTVTLIRPQGCMHCVAVKSVLEELKKDYPNLSVEDLDMETEEGMSLVQKHQILASPGILINGEYFASGGATKDQLRKKFEELNS